jgi:hypothetical protein
MSGRSVISSYVVIRNNQVIVKGETVFEKAGLAAPDFLLAVYDHFEVNYPKFFKMDNLCKTGFLAAELLLRNRGISEELKPEEIGIVFSNANSSLDTDIRYEASITTAPSPSLFVYTLPNVLIGELCIRNKIKGETACFVFDIFDPAFQSNYVNLLLETGKVKTCLSGWADYYGGKAEAFFYLVEKDGDFEAPEHSIENLNRIWTT